MPGHPTVLDDGKDVQAVFEVVAYPPANLPSPNPTHSFWTHSSIDANPLAREGSTGPLTTDADICIIGSGITGVSVAYHLSESVANEPVSASPLRVVILEARDFCGAATGRNGGHLTPLSFSGFATREKAHGIDEAMRSVALESHTTSSLLDIIEKHGWGEDLDVVEGGHIDLLFTEDEVQQAMSDLERAKSAGVDHSKVLWYSKEEIQKTFGAQYPGVRKPGANLWPLKLVTKLYQRAKQSIGGHLDLTLHTHTPVTAVQKLNQTDCESGRTSLVSTPRGSILCSRVVHATNGYASHLLPFLAGPDGIVPMRGQVIATRASVGTEVIKTSGWAGNNGSEYWFPRPLKHGEEKPLIILGGGREASEPPFESYVDDDSSVNELIGKTLREFLPTVFDGKFEHGKEPEMEWTGIMGYTAMGDPFVGPVIDIVTGDRSSYEGQYIAAGYTGHGMPRAFACAEVIAQMIMTELGGEHWSPPIWLPRRYLTWNRIKHRN